MTTMFLILALFINSPAALIPSSARANQPIQDTRPLSLKQIEQMIEGGFDDEVVAREISERGLAFRLPAATLEQLIKRGAGGQTRQALLRQEERTAYEAYVNEKQDAAKRLALGKEFLLRHPRSEHAAEVGAGNRKAMLDVFDAESRIFNANPDAKSLGRLLAMGGEILDQKPGRAVAVQVTSQLALATGRGMIGNFYSNLDQSRAYATQALNLLEDKAPPPDLDAAEYDRLRANSISLLYQVQGLYLLRQQNPDPEQAIGYLTSAAESKDSPSAKDPNTYWMRALARDMIYQKYIEEYRAMPGNRRAGKQGQSLCAKIRPIADQLFDDYLRVIDLSRVSGSLQLSEEARAALKSLSSTDRPCLAGRIELLDELPAEENRFALVIGVEDYLDQRVGKFNYAASDARAVADALAEHAGFRKDRIVLLATGQASERQPSRSAILQQLANLQERFSGANKGNEASGADGANGDGFLLIYFSGHNVERGGKNYLLPSDALTTNDTLLSETAISVDRIKELIRASGAGQVMLIIDAFRQEPLNEAFKGGFTFDTRNQEVAAFATLLATSVGRRAYESQAKKQSYFTSALIEALKGRAAGGGREVTLDRLVKYLETNVPAETQRDLGGGAEQRPLAIIAGYQSDELALAVSEGGTQPRGPSAKPDPAELARNSKSIHIRSGTLFLRAKLLEDELLKLPDFQRLGLKIVADPKDADLVVDVTLPFLSWTWTYVVMHQGANTRLANGKIREITAGPASVKLAKDVVMRLQEARAPAAPKR
ncbi:MAG TPA: caspase family protein [Blastocatellia bacterium]|nr:caspase family protein [Blastocatellia bacterium]